MQDELKRRLGLNEAAFRRVNESLRASTRLADVDARFPFVCECAVLGCNAVIELTLPEYEAVRRDSRRFVVVPGHEVPEVERVVQQSERFAVVEKLEASADEADLTDPR